MSNSDNCGYREPSPHSVPGDGKAHSSTNDQSQTDSMTKTLTTRNESSSSEQRSDSSKEKIIPNLGRRGDPRMHRAVAIKNANPDPNFSLLDALRAGGFKYPNDKEISGKSDREIFDDEGVKLSQRKNQLTRRLRHIRKRSKLDSSSSGSTDQNSGGISFHGDRMGMGLLDQFVSYKNMQMMNFPQIHEGSNVHHTTGVQNHVLNDNRDVYTNEDSLLPKDLSRFLTSTSSDMKIMPSDTQVQVPFTFNSQSDDKRMQLAKQIYYFEKQDLLIKSLLKAGYTAREIAESPTLVSQFEEELEKNLFFQNLTY